MKSDGTNLLLLTISAFCGHLDELQKVDYYPIRWSLYTSFTITNMTKPMKT